MGTKIALAIVTNRNVQAQTVLSIAELIAKTKYEIYPIVATEGYTIAENRNYCVFKAINEGCSHILFIDDDMTFPNTVIDTLMAHNKPIVGVASNSRMLPLRPTVALLDKHEDIDVPKVLESRDELPTEPFQCYSVGMGVALIDMCVFEKVPQPWFAFTAAKSGKMLVGEDEHLCNQARMNGLEVWCDPTIEIGHLGIYKY